MHSWFGASLGGGFSQEAVGWQFYWHGSGWVCPRYWGVRSMDMLHAPTVASLTVGVPGTVSTDAGVLVILMWLV